MSTEITVDLLRQALPRAQRGMATAEVVERFNQAAAGEMADQLRENFLGYMDVLQEGKFKIEDYLNAVKYVSYKVMGKSNRTAYSLVFPDRFTRLMADATLCTEIDSYVTAYNKGKLVNLILAQTMVPTHVLNQDMFQKALGVQMELALTAQSEMVRSQAANSILTILKVPETAKVKIDVNVKNDNSIEMLQEMMARVASDQLGLINQGVPLKAITNAPLVIEGDYEQVS
jgi:hypothetical protein